MARIENQLKQEKVENKVHQQQIKKLKGDLLAMDSEVYKGQETKNILAEKESTIQLLKKKLKIPSTQLIQDSKLTELEKESESLSQELNDSKARLLNLAGEQNQWEKEKGFLIAKIDVLNENQLDLEKEREQKHKYKLKETGQQTI